MSMAGTGSTMAGSGSTMAGTGSTMDGYEIFRDDEHELGSGSYGLVWKGRHIQSNTDVAVKRVRLGDESTKEGREWNQKYVDGEIQALRAIDHANIVKLYHSKKMDKYMYMFLEFCEEGNLNAFVTTQHQLTTETCCQNFMDDIAAALECLHAQDPPIIHRDVKPANILVTKRGQAARYSLKLTDFGTARRIPASVAAMTLTAWGTTNWMAPEVCPDCDGNVRFNKECDVYSAGLVFLSLLDHVVGHQLIARKVGEVSLGVWITKQPKPVKMPAISMDGDSKYKAMIKKLIQHMICPEPAHRCTMHMVRDVLQICADLISSEEQNRVVKEQLQSEMNQVLRARQHELRGAQENLASEKAAHCETKAELQALRLQNEAQKAALEENVQGFETFTSQYEALQADHFQTLKAHEEALQTECARMQMERVQIMKAYRETSARGLEAAAADRSQRYDEKSCPAGALGVMQQNPSSAGSYAPPRDKHPGKKLELFEDDSTTDRQHRGEAGESSKAAAVRTSQRYESDWARTSGDVKRPSYSTLYSGQLNKYCFNRLSGVHDMVQHEKPGEERPADSSHPAPEEEEPDDCPICLSPIEDLECLSKCGHKFCKDCIRQYFKNKPACPICGVVYGKIRGNQPKDGKMKHYTKSSLHLPGYEKYGAIVIEYDFNGGIQTEEHPNPGKYYSGTSRRAFLPDCPEGRIVLGLLKQAFEARIIFTIGTSVISGLENTVTWNVIHHKTNPHGGPQRYGYPDPTYLSRVKQELAEKGIVF